jgi:hypothetical protein
VSSGGGARAYYATAGVAPVGGIGSVARWVWRTRYDTHPPCDVSAARCGVRGGPAWCVVRRAGRRVVGGQHLRARILEVRRALDFRTLPADPSACGGTPTPQ